MAAVRVAVGCLLACAAVVLCVVMRGGEVAASALYQYPGKGGGLYGFQRDETAVNNAERRWAMQTLLKSAGGGVKLLTAKDAADEQLRWLRPFYARQMKAAERVWGTSPVASAVDIEGRGVHYKAVYENKQSEWAKAAMGSRTVTLDPRVVPPSQAREKADAQAVHSSYHSDNAKMQQLAEIYGVRISDHDAHKFFGTDYETKYTQPSQKKLHDYIQYLADHPPPKAGNSTDDAEEEAEDDAEDECAEGDEECDEAKKKKAWPAKPKFGKKYKTYAATQWCKWPGGEEEVPCQLGANGAYYDEPFSAGLWGRHTPNRETLVNNGVWRFPGSKPPKARSPPKIVRLSPTAGVHNVRHL